MAILATVLALMLPSPEVARYASPVAPTGSTADYLAQRESAVETARTAGNDRPARRYRAKHKGCNTSKCDRRMDRKIARRASARKWRFVRPHNSWLENTARCESGGNWRINTGNGFYGGLQFTYQSWRAVGGQGYPHQNSVLEQKYRGVKLLYLQGRSAWPVCG